ncbi:BA75_02068T0 [Komagataella pastoris]|uniref:BA75_02068T0 n=1 Tax=Komagataella pastoris TaxID=4922 RepID=A0A1B2JBZ5_PICPA|nr:BA75_02068T0 [Komagataella pastoris]
MESQLIHTVELGDWALSIASLNNHGIVVGLSDGSLNLVDSNGGFSKINAHSGCISTLTNVDKDNVVATAAADGVKVWDFRCINQGPVSKFSNEKNVPFLSLDSKHGLLGAGSELEGTDSEIYIWDLRNSSPLRKLSESHHDDITEVKFHGTNKDLLLSGSTDGYVNIYDLTFPEEEDALHQVINFASIHSADFLSSSRIYTLSHMETFAIHELNDKSTDLKEPQPVQFGDVREPWSCEYVVGIYPGYVACGSNSQESLTLYPFQDEKVDTERRVTLKPAHGEEIVRDVLLKDSRIYTAGEDSKLKIWQNSHWPVSDETPNAEESQTSKDENTMNEEYRKFKNHRKDGSNEQKSKKKTKDKHSSRFKPY